MLLLRHRFLIILPRATANQQLLEDLGDLAMIIEQLGHDYRRDWNIFLWKAKKMAIIRWVQVVRLSLFLMGAELNILNLYHVLAFIGNES